MSHRHEFERKRELLRTVRSLVMVREPAASARDCGSSTVPQYSKWTKQTSVVERHSKFTPPLPPPPKKIDDPRIQFAPVDALIEHSNTDSRSLFKRRSAREFRKEIFPFICPALYYTPPSLPLLRAVQNFPHLSRGPPRIHKINVSRRWISLGKFVSAGVSKDQAKTAP